MLSTSQLKNVSKIAFSWETEQINAVHVLVISSLVALVPLDARQPQRPTSVACVVAVTG